MFTQENPFLAKSW